MIAASNKRGGVVFVVPRYSSEVAEHFRHTLRLAERVAEHTRVAVLIERAKGTPDLAGIEHVRVLRWAEWRPLRLLETFAYGVVMRLKGYDRFYVRISVTAALPLAIVARLLGARQYLWNCGVAPDLPPLFSSAGLKQRLDQVPFRLALKLSHRLVTGTEGMARYYERAFGQPVARTVVLPNDIDVVRYPTATPEARVEARRALGIGEDEDVALFVHHLSRRKGVQYLPELARRLRAARGPRFRLLVVGNGPERARLEEEVATSGVADAVQLLGAVPNERIVRLYHAADVFLMPSDEEGFPRVLLEAMACGVPFVATRVGGVAEVVGPQLVGQVVEPGDVSAMVQICTRLLEDPDERRSLVERGHSRLQGYRVEEVARLFAERIAAP